MTYFDDNGDPVEVCHPDIFTDEPTASDLSATQIYARLLAMASTPGQVAAAQSVVGMDERRPCEIALALRVSRQRFNKLRNQARQRMALMTGG